MFTLKLDQQTTYTLMAIMPLVIQVGALAFAIWVDAYFKPKQKRVFLALLSLVLLLIAQNYLDELFSQLELGDLSRTFTGMLGYILRPIILLLLLYQYNSQIIFIHIAKIMLFGIKAETINIKNISF